MFYAVLAGATLWLNRNRFVYLGTIKQILMLDFDIENPIGDAALYFAGICFVLGIIALIIFEIRDTAEKRKEKKLEIEKKMRK